MADVENVGNRPNGDPLYSDDYDGDGRRKLKSELPDVLDAFRSERQKPGLEIAVEGTTVFSADVESPPGNDPTSRLDVFFFHPARKHAQERLGASAYPLVELRDLVTIDGATVNPAIEHGDDIVRWVGLGDIQAETGDYEVRDLPGDRVKSNSHVFRGGDILFSRLRPKLRKVVLVPDDDEGGFCSAELLVFRAADTLFAKIDREYLSYLLRSDLVFGQLIYQVTGVGRPRVSADSVRKLLVPLPSVDAQRALVSELREARADALQLRHEAARKSEEAAARTAQAYESVLTELCPPPAAPTRRELAAAS